jgi:hypothetical protein
LDGELVLLAGNGLMRFLIPDVPPDSACFTRR